MYFSIILTTYNQINFLKRSVNSVLNQSFPNFEFIIIDNYSSDGTYEYLKKIQDNRIKILRFSNNGMYVRSKNFGIKNSSYEWLAFIDTDDVWTKDKLQQCYEVIKKKNIDLIYHSVNYLNINGSRIIKEKSKKLTFPVEKNFFLNGNFIAQSSVVVKKTKIQEINFFSEDTELFGWEDFDAWLKISASSDNFYFVDKVLGSIWFGKENISNLELMKKNLSKILDHYNDKCLEKYNFSIIDTWWFKYNQSLYFFKKKDFESVIRLTKVLPICAFRFYIRLLFFKFYSIHVFYFSSLVKKLFK